MGCLPIKANEDLILTQEHYSYKNRLELNHSKSFHANNSIVRLAVTSLFEEYTIDNKVAKVSEASIFLTKENIIKLRDHLSEILLNYNS